MEMPNDNKTPEIKNSLAELQDQIPEMEDLILKSPSTKEIWQLARKQKSLSLFEDGIEKVKNGVTSWEEFLRVAQPPLQQ